MGIMWPFGRDRDQRESQPRRGGLGSGGRDSACQSVVPAGLGEAGRPQRGPGSRRPAALSGALSAALWYVLYAAVSRPSEESFGLVVAHRVKHLEPNRHPVGVRLNLLCWWRLGRQSGVIWFPARASRLTLCCSSRG